MSKLLERWHELLARLSVSSIPIFFNNEGKDCILASGLILQHQSNYFLVSAGHVLSLQTDLTKNWTYVSITDGRGFYDLSNLDRYVLCASTSNDDYNTIDFGIISLPTRLGRRFEDLGYKIISFNECEMAASDREGFCVVGWPSHLLNRSTLYGKKFIGPLVFTTYKVQHPHLIKRTNPWEIHLDATYPERGINRQELNTLRFKGMSGGPIWSLPSLSDWLKDVDVEPKLAGITICDKNVGRHRIIKGFRIASTWDAIIENYEYLSSNHFTNPLIVIPSQRWSLLHHTLAFKEPSYFDSSLIKRDQ